MAKIRNNRFKTKAPAKNNPALINPKIRTAAGTACIEAYLEKGKKPMRLGSTKEMETKATTETTARPINILMAKVIF
ncbi:MAG: hypothetical protein ACREFE_02945 [Limisphaerales bacterium]